VQTLNNAVAIAAGAAHACALRADGTVHCWGDNSSGQLGNNSLTRRTSPVAAIGIAGDIGARSIVTHSGHVCALRGNGTVACWGGNGTGQLGNGTTVNSGVPVTVAGLANVTQIAVGNGHSCARIADGTVRCWGRNTDGQIGDGTFVSPRLTPTTVPNVSDVNAIVTGAFHTCVLLGGGVRCWGDNQSGQLGDLSTNDSSTPRTVLRATATPTPLGGVLSLASAASSTCARTLGGSVLCWGRNDLGQHGTNATTATQTTPRAMDTSDVIAIATGNHSCMVRLSGAVFCTGGNASGQLGDGTTTSRLRPVASTGTTSMASISVGAFHTCGVRSTGRALCWGDNQFGQLGDGTLVDRLVATQVPALTDLIAIATGSLHSCAIDASGRVFCWGLGGSGVLGDGTFGNSATPITVPSFAMNIDPVVAWRHARKLEATVLAQCDEGAHVFVRVTISQGSAIGTGSIVEACTDARDRHPVRVHAHGRLGFVPGAANAELEAVVRRHGRVIDVQQWTRTVTLVEED
jgi:alpha-tubulin suppressor-like RCC1 family protein